MMQLALYRGRRAENPSSRFFDWLICWWTNSEFSHAELVLSKPHEVGGWSYCGSSSIRDHGVRTKMIRFDPAKWLLVELDSTHEQTAAAKTWFEHHQGMAYDWLGILGFVVHRKWGRGKKWFCSEAVACALGLEQTTLSPNDLAAFYKAKT